MNKPFLLCTLVSALALLSACAMAAAPAPATASNRQARGGLPESPHPIAFVLPADAPEALRSAARDLADGLARLHPELRPSWTDRLPATGDAILLGTAAVPAIAAQLGAERPAAPEGFLVRTQTQSKRTVGIIAGADVAGAVFGVYALLERLGHGFTLSFDAPPPAAGRPFSFEGWSLDDRPLARERIVFDWHNFLSGCSSWNFPDWARWIDRSRKMRFNTVMVHAYGNNPMFTFSFGEREKPVGFLTTTANGRDWGTAHVNDVRRLAGGALFDGPVFGAEAALAPAERRAAESQSLMRRVFAHAAAQGMHVCFALDIDTFSANPQELILTLPEAARFRLADGKTWLPRPDTPEGFAFVRAQAEALFALYPQIDRLALWVRTDRTTWTDLKVQDLPPDWRMEFETRTRAEPELGRLERGPGRFGLGKLTAAWQRALAEAGRGDVRVWMGSWRFAWMREAHPWTPEGIAFLPLDWEVVHDKSQFDTPEGRAEVRALAVRRPVIPIAWAHHDDGHYIGRSYRPPARFLDVLADCGADSFGIIHWTTRPLDLYFRSLAEQVWSATANRPLADTCADLAARLFGAAAREAGGAYLLDWIERGPIFGRDTSDFFIDRPFPPERVAEALEGVRRRGALLDRAEAALAAEGGAAGGSATRLPGGSATGGLSDRLPGDAGVLTISGTTHSPRAHLAYFRGQEAFYAGFHEAEGAAQQALAALRRADFEEARRLVAPLQPERLVDTWAQASAACGITRGELGLLVTIHLKWISTVRALRQAVGLEPVRLDYGPTRHEELAQGPGRLSFRVDAAQALWRVLGERETKAPAFELGEAEAVRLPAGLPEDSPKSILPGLAEIARDGILVRGQPLKLDLRPFLAPRSGGPLPLQAGRHRVTLLFLGPRTAEEEAVRAEVTVRIAPKGKAAARASKASGGTVSKDGGAVTSGGARTKGGANTGGGTGTNARDGAQTITLAFERRTAGALVRAEARTFEVTLPEAGGIEVELTPRAGALALCGAVIEAVR